MPKKVSYALSMVWEYQKNNADAKNPLTSVDLARSAGLPQRFVAQIASSLKVGGILGSREGAGGGYWLAQDWEKVSLQDLLVILGEDRRLLGCLGGEIECQSAKQCPVRKVWERVEKVLKRELTRINLGEIK